MNQERNVPMVAHATIHRIQEEYKALLRLSPLSLEQLVGPENFNFSQFAAGFFPHPESDRLRAEAQKFGERYGVWLPSAKHHITCALYLYPMAESQRMLTMMKNLTIDFYLNDVMGRDLFRHLPPAKQRAARGLIRRLARAGSVPVADEGPIEIANRLVLAEFEASSPKRWYERFSQLYTHHLEITHRDGSSAGRGYIPTVDEYIERRCHLAGMYHIVQWVEYGEAQFLDWEELKEWGLDDKLKRLHKVTAAFGALSNDLFSFEKEVIDNGSDSNLVMVVALNRPEPTLHEALLEAGDICQDLFAEYLYLTGAFKRKATRLPEQLGRHLRTQLEGLHRCMQACWLWQVSTKRYKREHSVWLETTLSSVASAAG
jgi:Terpene synthase family 2, C-terminal metal binding